MIRSVTHILILALIVGALTTGSCRSEKTTAKAKTEQPVVYYQGRFDDSGWIGIPVKFRGKPFRFALDTGASHTFFLKKHLSVLGDPLQIISSSNSDRKTIPMNVYRADDFVFGRIRFEGNLLCETTHTVGFEVEDFDGFLGANALSDFVVQLDFKENQIRISDRVLVPKLSLGRSFKMIHQKKEHGRSPYLNLKIGKETNEPFLIDTGQLPRGIRINLETYNNLVKPDVPKSREEFALNPREVNGIVESQLDIKNEFPYQDVLLSESLRNMIGLPFLRRHDFVIFDFPNNVIYLEQKPPEKDGG